MNKLESDPANQVSNTSLLERIEKHNQKQAKAAEETRNIRPDFSTAKKEIDSDSEEPVIEDEDYTYIPRDPSELSADQEFDQFLRDEVEIKSKMGKLDHQIEQMMTLIDKVKPESPVTDVYIHPAEKKPTIAPVTSHEVFSYVNTLAGNQKKYIKDALKKENEYNGFC